MRLTVTYGLSLTPPQYSTYGEGSVDALNDDEPHSTALALDVSPIDVPAHTSKLPSRYPYLSRRLCTATYPIGVPAGMRTDSHGVGSNVETVIVPKLPSSAAPYASCSRCDRR